MEEMAGETWLRGEGKEMGGSPVSGKSPDVRVWSLLWVGRGSRGWSRRQHVRRAAHSICVAKGPPSQPSLAASGSLDQEGAEGRILGTVPPNPAGGLKHVYVPKQGRMETVLTPLWSIRVGCSVHRPQGRGKLCFFVCGSLS